MTRKTRSTRVLAGGAVLVALSLGVAACSSGSYSVMPAGPGASVMQDATSSDAMFAQMMIPHHEQAVVMSDYAETRAADPLIRALAQEIKAAQQPEIDLMRSWLAEWGAPEMSGAEAMGAHGGHGMAGMLTDEQLDELAVSDGAAFDLLFAAYMIEHHLGAIDMARDVLLTNGDPRVDELAREIIVVQETEILRLQAFLNGEQAGPVEITAISPSLGHLHGAVVSGDAVLVGSHDGVHRVDLGTGESQRIGDSADDFMGFAGNADSVLVASGHPGPGSDLPNPLGLITSVDGGVSWEPVSLTGVVDFHSLDVEGEQVVGWDTRGSLLWSTDVGRTWQEGPQVLPTSAVWFDGIVWLAGPEIGLATWVPGADAVEPVSPQIPAVLLAVSEDGSALWRIDRDGAVFRTLDGVEWSAAGRVLSVEAFAAERDRAFAVTMTSIQTLAPTD